MMIRKWNDLPDFMRKDEVRPYWEILWKKRYQVLIKRCFDFIMGIILFSVFLIPMVVIAFLVKMDSKGPIFYRQKRVTTYGRIFRIHKFRTMFNDADKIGTAVTVDNDVRITKIGLILRKYRLDEIPQLIDVIKGDMSFVGTRPEAVKYVKRYLPEYYATLLLPAGITSETSIRYKDEDKLLKDAGNIDDTYINQILPGKMRMNLTDIKRFSLLQDFRTMIMTVITVVKD